MEKKNIDMIQIIMEDIDLSLQENQIVDQTVFDSANGKVILYYNYLTDSMMVKVEKDSEVIIDTPGGRLTYNRLVEQIKELTGTK